MFIVRCSPATFLSGMSAVIASGCICEKILTMRMPDISSIEYLTKLKNQCYSKSIWIPKSTYSADPNEAKRERANPFTPGYSRVTLAMQNSGFRIGGTSSRLFESAIEDSDSVWAVEKLAFISCTGIKISWLMISLAGWLCPGLRFAPWTNRILLQFLLTLDTCRLWGL